MNDYQTMVLWRQQQKDATRRRKQEAFKRDALQSQREQATHGSRPLGWLRALMPRFRLPGLVPTSTQSINKPAS